ncbi:hypothetical protein ABEI18_24400 [Erwinia billingiae]
MIQQISRHYTRLTTTWIAMASGTLRNQHQGLHYLTDTVSANVKTLFT